MRWLYLLLAVWLPFCVAAQSSNSAHCTNTPARAWWKANSYDILLQVDSVTGYLDGRVLIRAQVTDQPQDSLQIDLVQPLRIKGLTYGEKPAAKLRQQENVWYIYDDFRKLKKGDIFELAISYGGDPIKAKQAPWDGGLVLSKDRQGRPWIGMACQGQGASLWLPCKDFQGEEPDSVSLSLIAPGDLQAIGNGRLMQKQDEGKLGTVWTWQVRNPINLYDISFYIGHYAHWSDTLHGAKGPLSLDYYVLRANLDKAKKHFEVVKPMLRCFEDKLGPYPFYEDGYKLVEAPYLGMEHQSAVAYGNEYKMGYRGKDRSRTGAGLDFDFIIVHESGHEWFGNSITAYDKADTWIHEGFTTYTETIFEECLKGKERAFLYQRGKKDIVRNDAPPQGQFGLCDEGSDDHYDKAALMIHMIRMIMNDDSRFFGMLQEMNRKYYHQIVEGKTIEQFMIGYSGKDLAGVFDQYLRRAMLPVLAFKLEKGVLYYQWKNCVPGFNMPVSFTFDGKVQWLYPTEQQQQMPVTAKDIVAGEDFLVDYEWD